MTALLKLRIDWRQSIRNTRKRESKRSPKLFVTREFQYFKLQIFTFNLYVYHLTRGFIASTRAFNNATRA